MMDLARYKQAIDQAYCCDEQTLVDTLIAELRAQNVNIADVSARAASLIESVRDNAVSHPLNELLQTYDLNQPEGAQLMALAEALLRTKNTQSAHALILDKVTEGHWQTMDAQQRGWNKASQALLAFTSHTLKANGEPLHDRLGKLALPVVHRVMRRVVKSIASQFVFAQSIHEALENIQFHLCANENFSLDMLGEAAVTYQDAERFYRNYRHALERMAHVSRSDNRRLKQTSLSVKLSALHPRYEIGREADASLVIVERLLDLCSLAKEHAIAITIDAEESDRLQLSLDIFERVFLHENLVDYHGLGLAVQAYNKQALPVLAYLNALGEAAGKAIPVRLVKGAYWDSEIKNAQIQGLENYPVMTQKAHTDLHYLACAHYLLGKATNLVPQFATHNALTLAHILTIVKSDQAFECQRLFGMGEAVYDQAFKLYPALHCRVYGPVGEHEQLLAYLVRRILENGANNAFVRQLANSDIAIDELTKHPLELPLSPSTIPLPSEILGSRKKAKGLHWASFSARKNFLQKIEKNRKSRREAAIPLVAFECQIEPPKAIYNPYNGRQMGVYYALSPTELPKVLNEAHKASVEWRSVPVVQKAQILLTFAEYLDAERDKFIALLVDEAGKTLSDAIEEVREAIDFARYYAEQAMSSLNTQVFNGPTGELNSLTWRGRGVFFCVSPWNFPLAIFTGQVLAALVAGNCVVAKPASQTPLVAFHVVKLLHKAGVKSAELQFVPVAGAALNQTFLQDAQLSGVAFTGSNNTANTIQHALVGRRTGFIPFIAETGGQNAMVVEATALPEQVVRDVMRSAFSSAGQRCSALRMLYIQDSVFDTVIEMLAEALHTLKLGDPAKMETDVGPIIDADAKKTLQIYLDKKIAAGRVYAKAMLPEQCANTFIAPHIIGVNSILDIDQEYFGPILHIARFHFNDIDRVINDINQTGFGLTFGVHSRNKTFIDSVCGKVTVGNIYINRTMTGAVVGVQPFGGQGLSGTGFKAGGPNYLKRFATEVTISDNVAAIGGNTQLLAGRQDE